jgi:NAD(P)-dependent dehydrogenase (short-subunit alcohol dehydrogenase family)
MHPLKDKVAFVTGAGGERGIGREVAMQLARDGADVVVNDVRSGPDKAGGWGGLAQVVEEIRALGREALGVVGDVGDSQSVAEMVRQAIGRFGKIDILVNNAGARAGRDRVAVVDLDESDWDRVLRINIKGTFLCSREVARSMLAGHIAGRIINMSSTAGKTGRATYAAYASSKFAVIGFTQSLAQELAPHGITVNAICPSLIATERIDDLAQVQAPDATRTGEQRAALVARATSLSPLGRMASVGDVANVAAFLASDKASYLTGLAINVAGGAEVH